MQKLDSKQGTLLKDGKVLPLMEEFYTLQGEGYHTGKPAYFIRVGGCDVGCHWCDVKESWDASLHPLTKTDNIIMNVKDNPSRTVVITGGEPLMYNLDYICNRLHDIGFNVHIETSGAYALSGSFEWICLSPKKTEPPKEEILQIADELKIIVHNHDDYRWAEKYAGMVSDNCKLYLQPEWSKVEGIMNNLVDYVQKNPKWAISLQSHKYMHIP